MNKLIDAGLFREIRYLMVANFLLFSTDNMESVLGYSAVNSASDPNISGKGIVIGCRYQY